jgi:hypothetical protein
MKQVTAGGSRYQRFSSRLNKKPPDHTPRLSRKGEAESYVLSAFDGRRTARELTEEPLARFGDCFPDDSGRPEFIQRIVDRCC